MYSLVRELPANHVKGHATEGTGSVDPGVEIAELNDNISPPHKNLRVIQDERAIAAEIEGIIHTWRSVKVRCGSTDLQL